MAPHVEEIVVIDIKRNTFFDQFSNVKLIESSLHQINILSKALKGVDIVYHFACSTVPGTSDKNHIIDLQNNLLGSLVLLDAMIVENVNNIVFLSSGGAVYGNSTIFPTPECAKIKPISSYGAIKASIEHYLSVYRTNYGINSIILRPSNVYGEGIGREGTFGFVTTVLSQIRQGNSVHIFGDGSIVRDFVYVDDFVNLLMKILYNFSPGIYNVASNEPLSLNSILALIKEVTSKDFKTEHFPERLFDVKRVELSTIKCMDTFKWKPQVNLKEGVKSLFK